MPAFWLATRLTPATASFLAPLALLSATPATAAAAALPSACNAQAQPCQWSGRGLRMQGIESARDTCSFFRFPHRMIVGQLKSLWGCFELVQNWCFDVLLNSVPAFAHPQFEVVVTASTCQPSAFEMPVLVVISPNDSAQIAKHFQQLKLSSTLPYHNPRSGTKCFHLAGWRLVSSSCVSN